MKCEEEDSGALTALSHWKFQLCLFQKSGFFRARVAGMLCIDPKRRETTWSQQRSFGRASPPVSSPSVLPPAPAHPPARSRSHAARPGASRSACGSPGAAGRVQTAL